METYEKSQCNQLDQQTRIWLQTLPCPVALWSRDRSFYLLNRSAKGVIQFSEEDLLSHASFWLEQVHADDQENFLNFQEELVKREMPVSYDYRFFPKGATEPIWIREVSVVANHKEIIPWNIVSAYTDISDLKHAHASRKRASNSINVIRPLIHDLQNRLQVVIMGLELASRGLKKEFDSERLLRMAYSMKYSLEDARDCLNSSQREDRFICQDPLMILEGACGEMRTQLERQRVGLRLIRREPLPRIQGDKKQIQKALGRIIRSCGGGLKNGGHLEVEAKPKKLGGQVYAQVRITSCPCSIKSNQSNASQSFSRMQKDQIELDIALASEMLRRYQGRVSIQNQSENAGQVTILIKASSN
jgi:PAS domain-containing protein